MARSRTATASVGVPGAVVELGQAELGVEGSAVEVLADRLDPGVADAGEQVAPVGLDGPAQRHPGRLVVAGSGGVAERGLERPTGRR